MADNTTLPGTGEVYASDDIGSVKYQRVKLSFGADGSAADWDGTQHIGEVGGNSDHVEIAITGSTTPAYSLNDVVGGKLTITSAMRISNGKGVLQSITMYDTANVHPGLECLIYRQDPANGTYTDNAAFALNTTDAGFLLHHVTISVSDWVQMGGTNLWVADVANIAKVVKASGSNANLYAVLIATGTFTLTSTTQLRAAFGFLRD